MDESKKTTRPALVTETQAGKRVTAGNYKLTPMGKSTRLSMPGNPIGFVWNRPASVAVETPDGEVTILPIRDYTRIIQVALLVASLAFSAVLWGTARQFRRN